VSVSTLTLTPGTSTTLVPGAGAGAQPHHHSPAPARPPTGAHAQAHARAITGDYDTWLSHVFPAAGCSHPIRLAGQIATVEADTGRLLHVAATETMPDGVIYKNCGNRRSAVCPSCAETYRRDAFELIRTGLVGGKTVPASIASHPAVFVTLTAPGFGPVHTRRTSRTGRALPCRPRRQPQPCPHGVDLRCNRNHTADEHTLGTPLCPDCYDHRAQVVWNNQAGELWRRTRINLDRTLTRQARRLGIDPKTLRLRYAKVAEMQRRGVIHFHAILRLDGAHPDLPGLILPPPDQLDVADLHQAVTTAVTATAFTTDPHPDQPAGWTITWGTQLDIRPIRLTGDGDLTDTAAAGYLAKYATKSTEATGHTSRRLDADTIHVYADPAGTHPQRLVAACWTLGRHRDWAALRRWAHMLGYGGHFLTKARHYSLTFAELRAIRITWRRAQQQQAEHDRETTLVIGWLTYIGAGWRTNGDALLANTAAAKARERRQAARDELATTH
jgi:hypothetical protein